MTKNAVLFVTLVAMALLSGCYYDNEQDLYPTNQPCDTTNISYSEVVFPIISNNCTSCHTGIGAGGNVPLDDYYSITSAAKNGSLMGSIHHETGWSPMPKNAEKLADCHIKKLEVWIAEGTPDN